MSSKQLDRWAHSIFDDEALVLADLGQFATDPGDACFSVKDVPAEIAPAGNAPTATLAADYRRLSADVSAILAACESNDYTTAARRADAAQNELLGLHLDIAGAR